MYAATTTIHYKGSKLSKVCMSYEEKDDKMFGPGTYDMKAGGYLALQAMAALYKEKQPARPVELLLVEALICPS